MLPHLRTASPFEIKSRQPRHVLGRHLGEPADAQACDLADLSISVGESGVGDSELQDLGRVPEDARRAGRPAISPACRAAVFHDERVCQAKLLTMKLQFSLGLRGTGHQRDTSPFEHFPCGPGWLPLVARPVKKAAVEIAENDELS